MAMGAVGQFPRTPVSQELGLSDFPIRFFLLLGRLLRLGKSMGMLTLKGLFFAFPLKPKIFF
jgi:hypothetical protein